MRALALVLLTCATYATACSGDREDSPSAVREAPARASPAQARASPPARAATGGPAALLPTPPSPAAISDPPSQDRGDVDETAVDTWQPSRHPLRGAQRRWVQLILRSTPPGALVAVDDQPIGPTPAYWEGLVDGSPHEFSFKKTGYAVARFRFIPVTSGVVHAPLVKLPTRRPEAGRIDRDLRGPSAIERPPDPRLSSRRGQDASAAAVAPPAPAP